MAKKLQVYTRRFLVICNIILAIVFFIACLVPYLDPQSWWFISLLGLAFPFLLVLVILSGIAWLVFLKPKYAIISAIALLVGFKSISVFFAFQSTTVFNYKKDPKTLRVISWNVARFIELRKSNSGSKGVRKKMFDLIKQQDADILCLQEFHTSTDSAYYDNITAIRDELNYPFYYFSFDNDGDKHYYSSVIFSRLPIIDTGKVRYPRPTLPDVLMNIDVKLGADTVRIYTTHLQSLQFRAKDYEKINKIKSASDSLLTNSKSILSKLRKGFSYRSIQANLSHEVMKNSPHPVIFCGDLNDIPNSYTYATMRGNMQDAFLKKGFGIGRTFSALSPTLRIDYIFADNKFRIKQFNRVVKNYSDHYMIVADLELR